MERLKDHCTVISGFAFKSADLHDYDDIPIIKIGNISNGGNIDIKKETQYVSNEFLSIDKKYHINCGDILISLTGSHINQPNSIVGRSCRSYDTDTYLLNQRAGKVICNDDTNDDYMYYLLNLRAVKENIVNRAYGAANQINVSPSDIMKIKWTFPDIIIQNRIGAILSNYDKLIFINTKRIKTLEQMAKNLYKEWFVRFRFPGHENAEFENGIPKGWEIKRLGDFGRVETGKTPSMEIKENYGDEYLFIKTPEMHGNTFVIDTEEKLSEQGHQSQRKKLLPPNSIMVSCIGSGGIVAINAEPAHTNQQINSIILDDLQYLGWLFFTCKSMKETIEMFGATGSTMTNLSKGKFERLKVTKPPKEIIAQYHEIANPLLEEIKHLTIINKKIIKQRDLLLPRLMSGKLEV